MPFAFDETFSERWKRRAVTGPALLTVTPAYLAALPATLGVCAVADLARGRPWPATRFATALGANLGMHVVGFAAVFAGWLVGRFDRERERQLEQRMQVWWAETIWRSLERLYELNLEVEGDDCLAEPGPILLLSRHASLVDTLLPLVILGGRHDRPLRYVMKRELLWDPCIDAIGHRWPTAFVRRGTGASKEISHVARLGERLGERDGVVLFPEGTRFSVGKRRRIIEKLRAEKPHLADYAESLRAVLPPHSAGFGALLDAEPRLDVVFCAHTGLETANHFEDLISGKLLGETIKARFWRVPRAEVPNDHAERSAWLQDQWSRVDDWVATHRDPHEGGGELVVVEL